MRRVGLRRKRIRHNQQIERQRLWNISNRKSISEALSVLAKHGAEAKVIAGGTDVMVDIKFKEEPGSLVNIKKLPGLSGIKENGGSLRIGALATIRDLETNALVREKLPVLWEACASVRIITSAQHGDHRRQHLPGFAFRRNAGAAARIGSNRQVRFLGRRKEPSRSRRFFRARENPFLARKVF